MQLLDAQALQAGAPAQPSASAGPGQPALMLLTSGSTGTPKGVVLSRGNLAAMISGVQQQLRFVPGETALNWMPLDHVGGVVFLCVMPTVLGLDQVQVDTATILEAPARWLDLVAEHRVAAVWAPNFAFDLLLRAARGQAPGHWDLSCLRMLINAGEPVSEPVLVDFERRFAQDGLRQGAVWMSFGMTETVSAFSLRCWTASGEAVTSLGHPIAGGAQRIVDDAGRTLMEGEIGRVELSGPSVFSGYHGRPDLTAEALRDGWFQTGDMGFLRSGELHIVGRVKEMIIVNGANFYSAEIEEAAARVPGLDRQGLAAIGVRPAGAATDQLVLFFHAPGAGEPQLRRSLMRALRMRLGQDLGLAVDHFIAVPPERLPRTGAGKVQRVELRRLVEAGAFDREIKDAACLIGGAGTVPAWFARPVCVRASTMRRRPWRLRRRMRWLWRCVVPAPRRWRNCRPCSPVTAGWRWTIPAHQPTPWPRCASGRLMCWCWPVNRRWRLACCRQPAGWPPPAGMCQAGCWSAQVRARTKASGRWRARSCAVWRLKCPACAAAMSPGTTPPPTPMPVPLPMPPFWMPPGCVRNWAAASASPRCCGMPACGGCGACCPWSPMLQGIRDSRSRGCTCWPVGWGAWAFCWRGTCSAGTAPGCSSSAVPLLWSAGSHWNCLRAAGRSCTCRPMSPTPPPFRPR
ncbi:hypothetical protein GY14_03390 [Delftia tsuruhatensis]|nr:hypothetical protein GY14_03390 [Delftia tsuruhatensis]